MKTREADAQRSSRHKHVLSASLTAVILAALVSGPWLYGVVTDKHTEGRWTLVTALPHPEQSRRPSPLPGGLTLTVEDDEVRGQGPCNSFRSRWSQDTGITGDMTVTAILCPPHVMDQEDVYFADIAAVTRVAVQDDRMTLSGPAGQMQFERAD